MPAGLGRQHCPNPGIGSAAGNFQQSYRKVKHAVRHAEAIYRSGEAADSGNPAMGRIES